MKMECMLSVTLIAAVLSDAAIGKGLVAEQGDAAWFWEDGGVVLAEVVTLPPGGSVGNTTVVRPIGTLSGRFDASLYSEKAVHVTNQGQTFGWNTYPHVKGQTVLVVLDNNRHLSLLSFRMAFMRESEEPMQAVDGFRDPQVEATLKAIQGVRKDECAREQSHPSQPPYGRTAPKPEVDKYWSSHAVLYAEIKDVAGLDFSVAVKSFALVLRPKLTLAGAFDAGKTPEISVRAHGGDFASCKVPEAGDKVLVAIQRDGDSYRLAPENPAYMPDSDGRREPICFVIGFSDPRVADTVTALKALRKANIGKLPSCHDVYGWAGKSAR